MSIKYPNTRILSIFTQSSVADEQVLFIWCNPVPDCYRLDKVFWYDKEGKGGNASSIWPDQNVKHWMVVGTDDQIIPLYKAITDRQPLLIDGQKVYFRLPEYYNNDTGEQEQVYLEAETNKILLFAKHKDTMVPQFFKDQVLLDIFCGYKTNDQIRSINVAGLYGQGEIYQYLSKGVIGVLAERVPYVHISNFTPAKPNVGLRSMDGFCQQNYDHGKCYPISLHNEHEEKIVDTTINPVNGRFTIEFSNQIKNGFLQFPDGSLSIKKKYFAFINKLNIRGSMVGAVLHDIYGQQIDISEHNSIPPTVYTPLTWQQENYGPSTLPNIALSDQIFVTLGYLGPNVLIADPYFMGVMTVETTNTRNELKLSHDQESFLNAVITARHLYGLQNLLLLGTNKVAKIKPLIEEVETDLRPDSSALVASIPIDTTRLTFAEIIANYKLLLKIQKDADKHLPAFQFLSSPQRFHNRYWFSLRQQDGQWQFDRCIIVSTSLGDMDEVDFIEVTDERQRGTIIAKYSYLLQNANLL